jgi:N-acetyl-anhydromuramoyl-L-alanine amidase
MHMKINKNHQLEGHWPYGLENFSSPFFNQRPLNTPINLCVIHCISLPEGSYENGHIQKLFMGQLDISSHPSFESLNGLKVSSHLVITRSGKIMQFVPFDQRAWHAGVSIFEGRENCNDFSIGIELEGTDQDIFTDAQYEVLNQVIVLIKEKYPEVVGKNGQFRVVGHSDIAPGRKTDPGTGFDWSRIF